MRATAPGAAPVVAAIVERLAEHKRVPARASPLEWLPQALPSAFYLGFGPHHRWLANRLDIDGPSGVRALIGAPRGSGKSTFTTVGLSLIALARRSHWFHVICRTRADDAVRSVDVLEDHCGRLSDTYPWMHPVRRVDGELYLASGAIVVPRGTGSAIRGMQRARRAAIIRPDLFLGDDLETDESARSSMQVGRLEDWVHATVGQLGGPPGGADTQPLDILIAGTTLAPQSMMTRALDGEDQWATWDRGRFPAEGKVAGDGLVYDSQQRVVPLPAGEAAKGERVAMWPEGLPLEALDRLISADSPGFIGTRLYGQEYLLDPRSSTDALFARHLTRWERPGPNHQLVRAAVGVDAAASKRDAADYCAVARVHLLLRTDEWMTTPQGKRVRVHDLYVSPEVDRRRLGITGLCDWAEQVATTGELATVYFEANGGFLWGAQELRRRGRVPVRDVAASTDKRTRAQPMTVWHEARRILVDPALRGTPFDTELHSFTGTGDLHDDQVDGVVWAGYGATSAWRV